MIKIEEMTWQLNNSRYLLFDKSVLETIYSFNQSHSGTHESGGLLIGYFKKQHLHVTTVTTPYPKDKSSRTSFHREDPEHINELRRLYNKSGCYLNLLGEWHTHPERHPTPSGIDLKGWHELQNIRKKQSSIFLICGTDSFWVGDSKGNRFQLIEI